MQVSKRRGRSSKLLLLLSGAIPAALFLFAAWFDYRAVNARAREYVLTTTDALAEQTQEALETANQVLARTLDHIDGMDWQTINSSREVHDFLARINHELPSTQSVFLVDREGYNSASSRAFPMQRFDNRTREYYTAARAGEDRLFVTAAFRGQMTGQPGFTVSRPRLKDGVFDGLAAVTMSPAYFQKFYENISISPEVSSAALVRTDGQLLVRYPETKAIDQLPDTSPLLQAAKSGATQVVYLGVSTIDGNMKMAAFRRIDGQPLLANFALNESYYLSQWYAHLLWFATFALLTAAALFWAGLGVLRRTARDERYLRRLLQESERRKEAEDAVQHLQKMEALGRLSGGVAHDFNNLLAAISGALELAARRINEPDRLQRLLGTAMQATERGARLTRQMLAFSRHRDIAPQPLDINAIIRESDGLVQRTVAALVEVSYQLDEQLWPAMGDRAQFEVALLNLAANARDAMPLGGKLIIVTRNSNLNAAEADSLRAGDYVTVSITDTGEGMSRETLAKAFEPFFTTKVVGKGTGLGLSQVYGFAQQLGGTVRIRSALGEGTTVVVWLPRAQPVAKQAEEPCDRTDHIAANPLRILHVDDDQAVRLLTEEMLTELGHKVTSAANGTAALEALATPAVFDLLLADFAMPVMNGAELAAEAIKQRPQLSILFITGYADIEILSSWTSIGYRTLNKPFTSDELEAALRQIARSRAASGNVVTLPQR
jgi:signal transduction histidine kinase/ActR/RegA family two-component response regulator